VASKNRRIYDQGCNIINMLPGIEDCSYLELGVRDNINFEAIKCKTQMSVDINGKAKYTGTTDEYFTQTNIPNYDIIFIDANHDKEFVVRDYNNSIEYATKWVLIHDMIPPKKKHATSDRCSDSFRVLHYMMSNTNIELYPMDENLGLTLIKMPATKIKLDNASTNLTYELFKSFITNKKVYSRTEITKILRNSNV
jgi:hypothetical protein|tara:strand:- start:799 stop:1386 length:588 start_codon:yes stop_codon:yes gene_type:complete